MKSTHVGYGRDHNLAEILESQRPSRHATSGCAQAAAGLELRMNDAIAEPSQDYSTYALVRRLLVDEARGYWPRCANAFLLMGIAATATALTAYLLGTMTNEAYVNRDFHGIVVIGVIAMVIFTAKGFATYGGSVMLSSIGNSGDCATGCYSKTLVISPIGIRQSSSLASPPALPSSVR
jgi:hypothetical protein